MSDRVQAAALLEQSAHALAEARTELVSASAAAAKLVDDEDLRLGLSDVGDLGRDVEQIRQTAGPDIARRLGSAQGLAENAVFHIDQSWRRLNEVRGHVQRGAEALDGARGALDDLEALPGQATAATRALRDRVQGLESVVRDARQAADGTVSRMRSARSALGDIGFAPFDPSDSRRTADEVESRRTEASAGLRGAMDGVAQSRNSLAEAVPMAGAAAALSAELAANPDSRQHADLATAMGAAFPPSGPAQSGIAAGEADLRHRLGGQAQEHSRDR
jgi:hypothetical protein